MNPLQRVGTALIRFYQLAISPWLGPRCKYFPSCSTYAIEAIRVQGFWKGAALAAWRILRCNPWSRGGVDYPPGSTMGEDLWAGTAGDDTTKEHSHR